MTNPLVEIILRDDNIVRVNAPDFAAQNESNPMMGMIGGMAGMAAISASRENAPEMPDLPQMEGTSTIVTNGQIRANNTGEGSIRTDRGEMLLWEISSRTQTGPTALIDLSR